MFDSFRHSDSYNFYVPAVDAVNCSLLGLLNSGIRMVLKTFSHFVLPLETPPRPSEENPWPHLVPLLTLKSDSSSLSCAQSFQNGGFLYFVCFWLIQLRG